MLSHYRVMLVTAYYLLSADHWFRGGPEGPSQVEAPNSISTTPKHLFPRKIVRRKRPRTAEGASVHDCTAVRFPGQLRGHYTQRVPRPRRPNQQLDTKRLTVNIDVQVIRQAKSEIVSLERRKVSIEDHNRLLELAEVT